MEATKKIYIGTSDKQEDAKIFKHEEEEEDFDNFLEDEQASEQAILEGGKKKNKVEDEEASSRISEIDHLSDAESECTVDLLSTDPLFLVLSQFFMTKSGENIASVLDKINANLEKLLVSRRSP